MMFTGLFSIYALIQTCLYLTKKPLDFLLALSLLPETYLFRHPFSPLQSCEASWTLLKVAWEKYLAILWTLWKPWQGIVIAVEVWTILMSLPLSVSKYSLCLLTQLENGGETWSQNPVCFIISRSNCRTNEWGIHPQSWDSTGWFQVPGITCPWWKGLGNTSPVTKFSWV